MISPIVTETYNKILELQAVLAAPSGFSLLYSGISSYLLNQKDFKDDHELLIKQILKKRVALLKHFIESVDYVPDSIMEMKEFQGEDFFLQLDKYSCYKHEVEEMAPRYYKCKNRITNLFFFSFVVFIIGFLHPLLQFITFWVGLLTILGIFLQTKKNSLIAQRVHELKVCPDLVDSNLVE